MSTFRRSAPLLSLSLCALILSAASSASAQSPVAAKVASANKTKLLSLFKERNPQQIWRRKLIAGTSFKLSASAWKLMFSREGLDSLYSLSGQMAEYAKEHGLGDVDKVESAGTDARSKNQPAVDALLKKIKAKFGFSIEATQPQLSSAQGELLLRYVGFVGQFLAGEEFSPKSGRAQIKLVFSPAAQDVEVSAANGDTSFTILAPAQEPDDWNGKIGSGLKRFGKEG